MELADYLYIKRIKISEFARQIDASRSYISKITSRRMIPGRRIAKEIERLTDGCVTAFELRGESNDDN